MNKISQLLQMQRLKGRELSFYNTDFLNMCKNKVFFNIQFPQLSFLSKVTFKIPPTAVKATGFTFKHLLLINIFRL